MIRADYTHLTDQQLIEVLENSKAGHTMANDDAFSSMVIEALDRGLDPFEDGPAEDLI